MEYISTKELSLKWGISGTRIVVMAKKGRIDGAKLIGNTWLFPKDVEKPEDGRKNKRIKSGTDSYHFPLFYLTSQSMDDLSDIEMEYMESEKEFQSLNYKKARDSFLKILSKTDSPIIKGGCLYYLTLASCCLGDYESLIRYYENFNILLLSDFDHKEELSLLLPSLSYIRNGNEPVSITISDFDSLSSTALDVMTVFSSFNRLIQAYKNGSQIEIETYELFNLHLSSDSSILLRINMEMILSTMYKVNQNEKGYIDHLRKALSLGSSQRIYYTFLDFYPIIKQEILDLRNDYDKEYMDRIISEGESFAKNLYGFDKYKSNTKFPELSASDYEYLNYLLEGKTNKEIAALKEITSQAVFNKYSRLAEKFECESKKELQEKFKKQYILRK